MENQVVKEKEKPDFHPVWGVPMRDGGKLPTSFTLLGQGSFGEVYKGTNSISGEEVAIKIIPLTTKSASQREENLKEAEGYRKFEGNKNIVRVFDFFENYEKTKLYIVLEYCNKGTLNEQVEDRRMAQGGQNNFTLEELCDISKQVLKGLHDLHQQGVGYCHLDLKPENIGVKMENFKVRYKLLDFGFLFPKGEFEDYIIGTRSYMAPEILTDQNKDTKVDIFSFGCVLYELVFLENLFYSLTSNLDLHGLTEKQAKKRQSETFYEKIKQGLVLPDNRLPIMNEIILQSLALDPKQRPSAQQLLDLLESPAEVVLRPAISSGFQKREVEQVGMIDGLEGLGGRKEELKHKVTFMFESTDKTQLVNMKKYSGADNPSRILATSDWQYSGQVNPKTGHRHGLGCSLDLITGDFYFGFWAKDKKNGLGALVFGQKTPKFFPNAVPDFYVGDFQEDLMDSQSTLVFFADKMVFSGTMKQNQISGMGSLKYTKGDLYYRHSCKFDNGTKGERGELLVRHKSGQEWEYKGRFRGDEFVQGTMQDKKAQVKMDGDWTSLREGTGNIIYEKTGQKYTGSWENLQAQGVGKLFNREGVLIYEGEFEKGVYHGQGTRHLFDENDPKKTKVYKGSFENGEFHGQGVMDTREEKYKGEFSRGKMTGFGRLDFLHSQEFSYFEGRVEDGIPIEGALVYKNGDKYIGQLKDMKRNGKGKMEFEGATAKSNYFEYEGEWLDNNFHGRGTLYYKDKSSYEGDFVKGKRQGQGSYSVMGGNSITVFRGRFEKDVAVRGKYTYPNGSIYIGDVENNQRHGQGCIQYPNGDQYNGHFVKGEIEGMGLMNYADPKDQIYYGYFRQGKKNGEGELRTKDFEYFGNFKQDKRDGQGVIIFKTSALFAKYDGVFYSNYIHGKGKLVLTTGDLIAGVFVSRHIDKLEGEENYLFEGEPKMEDLDVSDCAITYKNGDLYKGKLVGGKRAGESTFECGVGKDRFNYHGNFHQGMMHGKGKLAYASGGSFEGELAHNELKMGTFIFEDGRKYTGPFANNKCSGQGKMVFRPDAHMKSYEGCFFEGELHGKGVVIKQNGDRFEGYFEKGHQTGPGILTRKKVIIDGHFHKFLPNGKVEVFYRETKNYFKGFMQEGISVTAEEGQPESEYWFECLSSEDPRRISNPRCKKYKGQFTDGRCTGTGTIIYPKDDVYVGEVVDATPHGTGRMIWANGDSYNGQWNRGEIVSNCGVWTFSEKNKEFMTYRGEFNKDNKFSGNGILVYRNSTTYTGMFYHHLRHGQGTERVTDTRDGVTKEIITFQGMFENGRKEGEAIIVDPVSAKAIRASFKKGIQR